VGAVGFLALIGEDEFASFFKGTPLGRLATS
jgi:hypothetical protein